MTIAFAGNFIHQKTGSKGIIPKVVEHLEKAGFQCFLVSKQEHKLLRQFDLAWQLLFRKYDVLHVDVFSGKGFLMAHLSSAIAKWRGKPVILNIRGGKFLEFFFGYKSYVTQILRKANLILTPSKFISEGLANEELPCRYFPNFIHLHEFPFSAAKSNVAPRLLWVRAFTEVYNPGLAIHSVARLKTKFPGIKLTMVGPDKGLLSASRKLMQSMGANDCIDVAGPVAHEKLAGWYQAHDIYLNTTRYESFGSALFEAAASGIPIVSTSVGEIPHLWEHGKNIMLVENECPEEFAKAVTHLLENPDLAKNMALEARKNAEQFDSRRIMQEWVEMFRQFQMKV